jgi:hypothetical protein
MRWVRTLWLCLLACGDSTPKHLDAPVAGCGSDADCVLPSAVGACVAGACTIASCLGATGDCDGDVANGCETRVDTDAHCGACTTACGSGDTCAFTGCRGSAASLACVAPVAPGLPAPACPAAAGDSDGDGLLDAWETAGYIDLDCNGAMDATDVPLPGAHVASPDLYVELDYLERPSDSCNPGPCTPCSIDDDCAAISGEQCGSAGVCIHTHRPKQAALDAVVAAMQPHVYLHVGVSDAIPEAGRTVIAFDAHDPACTGSDAADFHDVKNTYFGSGDPSSLATRARARVYHYVIAGHYSSCPPGPSTAPEQYCSVCLADRGGNPPKSGATGTSETPGNDVLVSLGALLFDLGIPLTTNTEAGTLMHELGHNLGLGHGVALDGAGNPVPAQSPNRSPNYLSVMNYNYQTLGVPLASAPGGTTASSFVVAYSDGTCPPLDEDHLDETAGAQCGASSKNVVYWAPGNFAGAATGGFNHHASATTGSPVNWDADASNTLLTDVAVDLNNDGVHQVHRSMNDWAALHVNTSCYAYTLLDGVSADELTAACARPGASRLGCERPSPSRSTMSAPTSAPSSRAGHGPASPRRNRTAASPTPRTTAGT